MENELHPIPQPFEVIKKERHEATGSYMMMFITLSIGLPLPFINLLASWVYWLLHKNRPPFVRFHMLQSLYSQLLITIANMAGVFFFIRTFIFESADSSMSTITIVVVLLVVANLLYFIMSIIGAVNANQGKMYYFYVIGGMSYQQAFRIKPQALDRDEDLYRRS